METQDQKNTNNTRFVYEMKILERHLDTLGHVNNASYLQIFEEARWDYITKNGFGLKELKEEMIFPAVIDVFVKFKKELSNRESIRVESSFIDRVGSFRYRLEQKIINAQGVVTTLAIFTFAIMDLKTRKLTTTTDDHLRAWGLL